jgi:hypothetical protein
MIRRLVYVPAFFAWKPIILVLLLASGACGGIISNVPVPITPRERLAVLEITYQEINRSIQDLVAVGTLHSKAAALVADFLEAASEAMRVARAGVDGLDGLVLLEAANQALIGLAARLREVETS